MKTVFLLRYIKKQVRYGLFTLFWKGRLKKCGFRRPLVRWMVFRSLICFLCRISRAQPTLPTAGSRAYPLALAAKAEAYRVFFERTGVAALGLKQGRLKKISDGLFQ